MFNKINDSRKVRVGKYMFMYILQNILNVLLKIWMHILGKMVKFGSDDYYMEETPLMFSRCSSLGSLSGFEQHSIHDDHSSVISDFR